MQRAVVALVCAVLSAALSAPALAQTTNGQLAVVLGNQIVAVNPDGSGLRTLYAPGSGDPISGPAWSPDGNRLAFSYQRKIAVLDLGDRSVVFLTQPGAATDLEPSWSPAGDYIGFRRDGGPLNQQRLSVKVNDPFRGSIRTHPLDVVPDALAIAPDLTTVAYRIGTALSWTGGGLDLSLGAADTPAWSATGADLAYVEAGSDAWAPGLRIVVDVRNGGPNRKVAELPVASPRWSPTADRLAFLRDGQAMTVPAAENARPLPVPGVAGATAVDWQPCRLDTVVGCESVLPPTCTTTTVQVTTQADQPVELPAPPCSDPAGRALRLVVVSPGEQGTLSGTVYTPRAGFIGQDAVSYRVSNGPATSELVRVAIFVLPRPAAAGPPVGNPPATAAAPYLSLRVRPALDRKRSTLARLSCDQACTFTVRIEGRLRAKNKRIKGKTVRRTLAGGRILALRLKLPAKPKGKLKTAVITGTVRGAGGATRSVKLPVTVRR